MKNVRRVALAGGIVWGVLMFLTTLASYYWGYATDFLKVWQSIYPGFTTSPTGSVVGLAYGFLDMYIGIYIISWVYSKVK